MRRSTRMWPRSTPATPNCSRHRSGRCRLPNAYLYDHDIIERVKKAVDASGQFQHTSVWAEGQRRWVTLKGCVQSRAQAQALQHLAGMSIMPGQNSQEMNVGVLDDFLIRR